MIPKKIHYCWLSGEKMPDFFTKCMETWKKVMPDYEIVLWDRNKFDVNSVPFVAEACSIKKWAFAADYIRLYAVYTEGGIYLDSDVIVKKRFDDFLNYDFFTSLEYGPEIQVGHDIMTRLLNEDGTLKNPVLQRVYGFGLQAAIFGGIKGHPFMKDCMKWYENNHYLLPNGQRREFNMEIAPDIYAYVAQNYGFRYKYGMQNLDKNMVILPSSVFPTGVNGPVQNAFAIHYCYHSWFDKPMHRKVRERLGKVRLIRRLFGKQQIFED
ncbi:MAG: polysaccharide biosynthesis protein [Bacteroidetes bacterium]|nr:polysaccharide biosynthesis protein [Bacteroidota bacterium]